jgi:hypothetical protein
VCRRTKTLALARAVHRFFTFDIKAFFLAQHPVRFAAEDLPVPLTCPLEETS